MNRDHIKLGGVAMLAGLSFGLTGCQSGSSGDTGVLNLSITDAPVDRAAAVFIEFDSVILQHSSGERVTFTYDPPRSIDLLALQGAASEPLLTGEQVPAGRYSWMRLGLRPFDGAQVPGDNLTSSYIEFPAEPDLPPSPTYLAIPSGLQTGLKLQGGFTVPANGEASYTLDFDLRRSIVTVPRQGGHAHPDYVLKPVVRMIDNAEVGHLAGVVDFSALDGVEPCSDTGAVYLFAGADAEAIDMQETAGPVTSALLNDRQDGTWGYEVGFLSVGDYTVALTCDAHLDDPEQDDSDVVNFVWEGNVRVIAGEEPTALNIPQVD